MILSDLVNRNARRFPNREAIICESIRITFAEFRDRVNRLANALFCNSVGRVSQTRRVSDCSGNSPYFSLSTLDLPMKNLITVILSHRR